MCDSSFACMNQTSCSAAGNTNVSLSLLSSFKNAHLPTCRLFDRQEYTLQTEVVHFLLAPGPITCFCIWRSEASCDAFMAEQPSRREQIKAMAKPSKTIERCHISLLADAELAYSLSCLSVVAVSERDEANLEFGHCLQLFKVFQRSWDNRSPFHLSTVKSHSIPFKNLK